jgi:fucose 4-O-acetylase-like acetyltransferase
LFRDLFNARYILSAGRLGWIDYARGICIILVCYRHCFDGLRESDLAVGDYPLLEILNVCFYSFRMPLFFIVSGLFVSRSLQKKSLKDYVWSRFSVVFTR